MIVGALGNIVVIVTVVRDKCFHRPPFYYLVSLAVSDMCRALFCMPFVLASIVQGSVWTHGVTSCTIVGFANTFFVFNSVSALMAIAVDRHLSIIYSQFHRRRSRGLMNLCVILLSWLVSFAVSFPPVFGMGTYTYITEESQCSFKHKQYRQNDTFGFVLVFTAICIGTLILYARIFIFLRKHRRMRPLDRLPARSSNWTFFGPGGNALVQLNMANGLPFPPAQIPTVTQNLSQASGSCPQIRVRKNEHLTRLFFIVTILFDCLWSMHLIQSYVIIFCGEAFVPIILRSIAAWFTFVQVCVCPVMFFFSNMRFRKVLRSNMFAYKRNDENTIESRQW